jgi:Conjugative transposon, TraM
VRKFLNKKIALALIFAVPILSIVIYMSFKPANSLQENNWLLKDLKAKPIEEDPSLDISDYEKIKLAKSQDNPKNKLRSKYKAESARKNPIATWHKPSKKPSKKEAILAPTKPQATQKKKAIELGEPSSVVGFFRGNNLDKTQEEEVYPAYFREAQEVKEGKAISIILAKDIPSLNLKKDTILKGVPGFGTDRIYIHITAGIYKDKEFSLKKENLICYSKEDRLEGLYHDELARQVQEAVKEGLIDEMTGLEFKGNRLVTKANNLFNLNKPIIILQNTELLVGISETKDN